MSSSESNSAAQLAAILRSIDEKESEYPEVDLFKFRQEFGNCDTHGNYPLNHLDENGIARYYAGDCPHCRRLIKMQGRLSSMKISKRFLHCDFENYVADSDQKTKALTACRNYADNFRDNWNKGRCLIMRGNVGTGKNHLATAIAKRVSKDRYSVIQLKTSEFLNQYWQKEYAERDNWIFELSEVDLVILDEVGRASDGKAANDALFRLLDGRYEAVKPIIILTNLDRKGLIETLGEAQYDRLRQGGGILLSFDWASHRGVAL